VDVTRHKSRPDLASAATPERHHLAQVSSYIPIRRQVDNRCTGGELVVVVLQHVSQIPGVEDPAAERAALDMPALLGYGIIRRASGYTS
jgi:hypothetical protein